MKRGNEVVHDGPGHGGGKGGHYLFQLLGLTEASDSDSCVGEQEPWGTVFRESLTCSAPVPV